MMRLFVYLPFIILSIACNNKEKNEKPVTTDPYPTLEVQRAALAGKPYATPVRLIDSLQLISDLQFFSSAACEGREPGTAGHALARTRILERLRATAVDSLGGSLIQPFSSSNINGSTEGLNVIGWVKGTSNAGKYLVLTAHYDHLGKDGSTIYYGADDNASGVACLLALADYFKAHPRPYSIVFAVLDREETGLRGAYAAVDWLQAKLGNQALAFNINMDMIARSDKGEIFVSGVKHFPDYAYVVNDVQPYTNVKVLMGHDSGSPGDDWTLQSDHAAFFAKQIPFLYVGVEDHPDYHKPTDTFERVNPSAYLENCNMVLQMIKALRL